MEHSTQLNIKGMVCDRCVQTIEDLIKRIGHSLKSIALGRVVFNDNLTSEEIKTVRGSLAELGFELLEDRNQKLLCAIKTSVHELVELNSDGERSQKLSTFLNEKFKKNYDSLSEFFGRYEGITIEKYYINTRITKVKELLVYTELSLSEIAFKVGFSSPHHLSNQFKSTVGLNPSEFRQIRRGKLMKE